LRERGRRLAAFLAGAWRTDPPPLGMSAHEAVDLVPLLLAGGAGALGHWRLRSSSLAQSPDLVPLHDTYRAYTLEAAVHEVQLAEAAQAFRGASVPALLGKGWAAARDYAQPALRPYGDLDFFVDPVDLGRGREALLQLARPLPVDLHRGFAELDDRGAQALFARATRADVRGATVDVLAPEDHLRLVVLHLLRHGASRPIWLCDVGALLEAAPISFDWALVLRGPRPRARSVAAVVWLTERLLSARVPNRSRLAELDDGAMPRWLEDTVLLQWGRGSAFRRPLGEEPLGPRRLLSTLPRRWPNAVEATAGMDAPFDDSPRWPHQAAFAAVRAFRFVRSGGRLDGQGTRTTRKDAAA
jgi:hypothetical protein